MASIFDDLIAKYNAINNYYDPNYKGKKINPLNGDWGNNLGGGSEAGEYHNNIVYLTEHFTGNVAYCITDNRVYAGITPNCNPIFTIQGNKVYRGPIANGMVAYTIGSDGHIWEGMFESGTCIGRIADGFVHLGGYMSCSCSFKIQTNI